VSRGDLDRATVDQRELRDHGAIAQLVQPVTVVRRGAADPGVLVGFCGPLAHTTILAGSAPGLLRPIRVIPISA
jgi:hypothetical protein